MINLQPENICHVMITAQPCSFKVKVGQCKSTITVKAKFHSFQIKAPLGRRNKLFAKANQTNLFRTFHGFHNFILLTLHGKSF